MNFFVGERHPPHQAAAILGKFQATFPPPSHPLPFERLAVEKPFLLNKSGMNLLKRSLGCVIRRPQKKIRNRQNKQSWSKKYSAKSCKAKTILSASFLMIVDAARMCSLRLSPKSTCGCTERLPILRNLSMVNGQIFFFLDSEILFITVSDSEGVLKKSSSLQHATGPVAASGTAAINTHEWCVSAVSGIVVSPPRREDRRKLG